MSIITKGIILAGDARDKLYPLDFSCGDAK